MGITFINRRLKRLVINHFEKSGEENIERYYARISSENTKFYDFLTTAAPTLCSNAVTFLSAKQVSDSDTVTPLLPPDQYFNMDLQNENLGSVDFQDASDSRSIYKYLSSQPKSANRKRSFVYGALYKNLMGNDFALIDCRGKGRLEIKVEIEGQRKNSIVTLMDASGSTDMLPHIVSLGKSLGNKGNSRKNVGDFGEMWGLGYRNKKTREVYVISNDLLVKKAMTNVCESVVKDLGLQFHNTFESIRQAESVSVQCPPLLEMGGMNGPGSCIMISKNLGNSAHLDYNDASMSLAVWVEERVGGATNWFFVMPNLRLNDKLGVVIQLFHGCVISWDGQLIKHCTSVTSTGDSNNVYGCMFGSCRSPKRGK